MQTDPRSKDFALLASCKVCCFSSVQSPAHQRPEAIPVMQPEQSALPLFLLAAIDPIAAAHCFKAFLLIAEKQTCHLNNSIQINAFHYTPNTTSKA